MPRELGYNPAKSSDQQFARRVVRLTWILLCFIIILVMRLFYLQIIQHHYYLVQEARNRSNLLILEPHRGTIYDRNGIVLASDASVYSLSIERDKTPHLQETLNQLQQLLKIDSKEIQIFLKDIRNHPRFTPIPLITNLNNQQIAKFMLNQYRFPGVSIQTTYIRYYPLGAALSAVTGYVSRINSQELKQVDPTNYSASTDIGKVGIEKYFESVLHGQIGYQRAQTDATGHQITIFNNHPPIPGSPLTLTIDSKLQQIAYNALAGQRGAVVAIQPQTGQILALVSSPAYDPNVFVNGIDNKTYQMLRDDPNQPLYNRAVRGTFPFGSTIKPFYALKGLETKTITPNFTIYDPGYFMLPGVSHIYHNWTWNAKHGGQGTVNVITALEQSNDTFFFNLAMKMGITQMATALHQFGFGKKTAIEISEESTGHIGTPEWKHLIKHQAWYAGDTLAAGIGQGYMTTTPLQLAQGLSMLAMRGVAHQPTLILKKPMADGQIANYQSPPLPPINFASTTWDVVLTGMKRVMTLGTGSYHFGQKEFGKPLYEAAGKTGTAQVAGLNNKKYNKNTTINLRDNSLFEVFAPADSPQIAVAVIVEHAETAGLVARQVIDYYLIDRTKLIAPTPKQPTKNQQPPNEKTHQEQPPANDDAVTGDEPPDPMDINDQISE